MSDIPHSNFFQSIFIQGDKAGIEFKFADYQATSLSLNNPAPHSFI